MPPECKECNSYTNKFRLLKKALLDLQKENSFDKEVISKLRCDIEEFKLQNKVQNDKECHLYATKIEVFKKSLFELKNENMQNHELISKLNNEIEELKSQNKLLDDNKENKCTSQFQDLDNMIKTLTSEKQNLIVKSNEKINENIILLQSKSNLELELKTKDEFINNINQKFEIDKRNFESKIEEINKLNQDLKNIIFTEAKSRKFCNICKETTELICDCFVRNDINLKNFISARRVLLSHIYDYRDKSFDDNSEILIESIKTILDKDDEIILNNNRTRNRSNSNCSDVSIVLAGSEQSQYHSNSDMELVDYYLTDNLDDKINNNVISYNELIGLKEMNIDKEEDKLGKKGDSVLVTIDRDSNTNNEDMSQPLAIINKVDNDRLTTNNYYDINDGYVFGNELTDDENDENDEDSMSNDQLHIAIGDNDNTNNSIQEPISITDTITQPLTPLNNITSNELSANKYNNINDYNLFGNELTDNEDDEDSISHDQLCIVIGEDITTNTVINTKVPNITNDTNTVITTNATNTINGTNTTNTVININATNTTNDTNTVITTNATNTTNHHHNNLTQEQSLSTTITNQLQDIIIKKPNNTNSYQDFYDDDEDINDSNIIKELMIPAIAQEVNNSHGEKNEEINDYDNNSGTSCDSSSSSSSDEDDNDDDMQMELGEVMLDTIIDTPLPEMTTLNNTNSFIEDNHKELHRQSPLLLSSSTTNKRPLSTQIHNQTHISPKRMKLSTNINDKTLVLQDIDCVTNNNDEIPSIYPNTNDQLQHSMTSSPQSILITTQYIQQSSNTLSNISTITSPVKYCNAYMSISPISSSSNINTYFPNIITSQNNQSNQIKSSSIQLDISDVTMSNHCEPLDLSFSSRISPDKSLKNNHSSIIDNHNDDQINNMSLTNESQMCPNRRSLNESSSSIIQSEDNNDILAQKTLTIINDISTVSYSTDNSISPINKEKTNLIPLINKENENNQISGNHGHLENKKKSKSISIIEIPSDKKEITPKTVINNPQTINTNIHKSSRNTQNYKNCQVSSSKATSNDMEKEEAIKAAEIQERMGIAKQVMESKNARPQTSSIQTKLIETMKKLSEKKNQERKVQQITATNKYQKGSRYTNKLLTEMQPLNRDNLVLERMTREELQNSRNTQVTTDSISGTKRVRKIADDEIGFKKSKLNVLKPKTRSIKESTNESTGFNKERESSRLMNVNLGQLLLNKNFAENDIYKFQQITTFTNSNPLLPEIDLPKRSNSSTCKQSQTLKKPELPPKKSFDDILNDLFSMVVKKADNEFNDVITKNLIIGEESEARGYVDAIFHFFKSGNFNAYQKKHVINITFFLVMSIIRQQQKIYPYYYSSLITFLHDSELPAILTLVLSNISFFVSVQQWEFLMNFLLDLIRLPNLPILMLVKVMTPTTVFPPIVRTKYSIIIEILKQLVLHEYSTAGDGEIKKIVESLPLNVQQFWLDGKAFDEVQKTNDIYSIIQLIKQTITTFQSSQLNLFQLDKDIKNKYSK